MSKVTVRSHHSKILITAVNWLANHSPDAATSICPLRGPVVHEIPGMWLIQIATVRCGSIGEPALNAKSEVGRQKRCANFYMAISKSAFEISGEFRLFRPEIRLEDFCSE